MGSQALEAAIGLVLLFFLLALVASGVVEMLSALLRKRSGDLEKAVNRMVGQSSHPDVPAFSDTSTYGRLRVADGHKPSYIPARAFGDAVIEIVGAARKGAADAEEMFAKLPSGLRERLRPILDRAGGDLTAVRAEAEVWFDDTMDRVAGTYKRWSQWVLFAVGLGLAVAVNASAFSVAARLWRDPVTRGVVAQAAGRTTAQAPDTPTDLRDVAAQVRAIDDISLPVGWSGPHPAGRGFGVLGTAFGWLATSLLVMMGAPFWFDLLTRLVSLRFAGRKPARAPDDPASAASQVLGGGPSAAAIGAVAVPAAAVAFGVPGEGVPAPMTPEERFFRALPG